MKRSEMVKLIAQTLEKNFDGDNGSWESDAEKVLEAIEGAGMRVPVSGDLDAQLRAVHLGKWELE